MIQVPCRQRRRMCRLVPPGDVCERHKNAGRHVHHVEAGSICLGSNCRSLTTNKAVLCAAIDHKNERMVDAFERAVEYFASVHDLRDAWKNEQQFKDEVAHALTRADFDHFDRLVEYLQYVEKHMGYTAAKFHGEFRDKAANPHVAPNPIESMHLTCLFAKKMVDLHDQKQSTGGYHDDTEEGGEGGAVRRSRSG